MSIHIGDAVVLPFDEKATNLDVQRLSCIVVAVNGNRVTTVDAYGVKCVSPLMGIHKLASYEDILKQLSQKGVELVGRVANR